MSRSSVSTGAQKKWRSREKIIERERGRGGEKKCIEVGEKEGEMGGEDGDVREKEREVGEKEGEVRRNEGEVGEKEREVGREEGEGEVGKQETNKRLNQFSRDSSLCRSLSLSLSQTHMRTRWRLGGHT